MNYKNTFSQTSTSELSKDLTIQAITLRGNSNLGSFGKHQSKIFKVFLFLTFSILGSSVFAISIVSTVAGGNWSSSTTWVGGIVPNASDDVTIVDGSTVTIDAASACQNLTVGQGISGVLIFESATAFTITVILDVSIESGGIFQSAVTGTVTSHILSIGGSLINNGTIDFSTNSNTAGAGIIFTGTVSNSFVLVGGSITNLKQTDGVTLNKGTNNSPVLTFSPGGTFAVLGANTEGFLKITNGTFKISGNNAFSNPLFNTASYSIPATGGLWMDNANATVIGLNGSPTLNGLFRMSKGIYNIGIAAGNSFGFNAGSTITIEGGAINSAGRFGVANAGNAIVYAQTGGTITVCKTGNTSTTLASFDLGTAAGTTNISGGTIVVQLASTAASGPRDYRNQSGAGSPGVTAGTLQLGNAASGAAKAFSIAGVLPDLLITNTSANHSATFLVAAVFNNITRNIILNTGTTLNVGNQVFLFNGTTLTNNGTLTANGGSTNFVWFLTTSPVSYTGSGVTTAPISNFAIQTEQGLTINPSSPNIVVGAIRLFNGNVTNANKITLGNGGATTGIVQIGNTTTPTAAGTFDVPFTFNLGTGGQTLSYLRTTTARTTGPEINSTRTLTSMTYDDNNSSHSLTLSGGNITVTGTTSLTNGRIITGANTQIVGIAGTLSRTNGYVDGTLQKTYTAASNKNFEVGTANGYSPVAVNITAGIFPTYFTVKSMQSGLPQIPGTDKLQRYWTLTGTGVTADLTFTYLDPTDITGTEGNYVIVKNTGATLSQPGGTINTGANTMTINGVTSFSDWTASDPDALTHAMIIKGNGITPLTIADEDDTPSLIDSTDFGTRFINISLDRRYTIENTKASAINITNIEVSGTNAGEFVVSEAPSSIAGNSSNTFKVSFIPTGTGIRTAAITINNSGSNPVYNYNIQGTGSKTYMYTGTGNWTDQGNWSPFYPGLTIPEGFAAEVGSGSVLTINVRVINNGILINNGTLNIGSGTLTNNGTYEGSGSYSGGVFVNPPLGTIAPGD